MPMNNKLIIGKTKIRLKKKYSCGYECHTFNFDFFWLNLLVIYKSQLTICTSGVYILQNTMVVGGGVLKRIFKGQKLNNFRRGAV